MDLNRGPLVLEVTALPTEPQPPSKAFKSFIPYFSYPVDNLF